MLAVGPPGEEDRHVPFRPIRPVEVAEYLGPVCQRNNAVAFNREALFGPPVIVGRRQRWFVGRAEWIHAGAGNA